MTLLQSYIHDLKCLTLFPKRYKTPQGKSSEYWGQVMRRYDNMGKKISCSDYHWRIITYDDGREELAYLRVLKGGLFSGLSSAIYRGPFIPHMISYGTFSHITDIRLAF